MKVLVLEDDAQQSMVITNYLETMGFDVVCIQEADMIFDWIEKTHFDMYILDVFLPDISGLEILKYIRQFDLETPIIMTTGADDIATITKAFDFGCSEYIKKPFHLKELEMRINKLLKKNSLQSMDSVVRFSEELHFEKENRNFRFKGKLLPLRKKERRFLEILIDNLGKVVLTDKIIYYVWENEIKEKYPMRQLVSGLRKKLPADLIQTEVGLGYKIEHGKNDE